MVLLGAEAALTGTVLCQAPDQGPHAGTSPLRAALAAAQGPQEPGEERKPPFFGNGGLKEFGLVPPAGFEPALPPPEGGALSPELRGPRWLGAGE